MIARNYIKHPEALLMQHELSLVFAAGKVTSNAELDLMRGSFEASGKWIRSYATKAAKTAKTIPAWWKATKKRAKDLARRVKEAVIGLFAK